MLGAWRGAGVHAWGADEFGEVAVKLVWQLNIPQDDCGKNKKENNFFLFVLASAHSEKYILHRHPVPVNKYTGLQKQPYPLWGAL